jgi:hypothetical protein
VAKLGRWVGGWVGGGGGGGVQHPPPTQTPSTSSLPQLTITAVQPLFDMCLLLAAAQCPSRGRCW